MKNSLSSEPNETLGKLLKRVMALHSFNYKTLAEAKKTVCIGELEYCFDALSLSLYHSNLNGVLYSEFKRRLNKFYKDNYDREAQKERDERTALFQYLTADSCSFQNYSIVKKERPDFVLEGQGQRIGIEVVELTTQYDKVLSSIAEKNFGQRKTAFEIESEAKRVHGAKAANYEYLDINGSACVGTGVFDVGEKQKRFACQFYEKYQKYKEDIPAFDRFIVLGDAVRSLDVSISDKKDVNNIFEWLETAPDLANVSFVILWLNGSSKISVSQFDV